jgi:hypothetical protein
VRAALSVGNTAALSRDPGFHQFFETAARQPALILLPDPVRLPPSRKLPESNRRQDSLVVGSAAGGPFNNEEGT